MEKTVKTYIAVAILVVTGAVYGVTVSSNPPAAHAEVNKVFTITHTVETKKITDDFSFSAMMDDQISSQLALNVKE